MTSFARSARRALSVAPFLVLACSSSAPSGVGSSGGTRADGPDAGGLCAQAEDPNLNPCSGGPCTLLPPTCATSCTSLGAVRFHLEVASDNAAAYGAVAYSWGADPVNWFTVSTAAGAALQVVPPTSDAGQGLLWAASCSACTSIEIAPLESLQTLSAGNGLTSTWNGTTYSLTSTCNQGQNGAVPCGDVTCAPAGSYVVQMCATPTSSTTGTPSCVSVPFTFPGTADVTGTLSP